jgi:hypothetical protein
MPLDLKDRGVPEIRTSAGATLNHATNGAADARRQMEQ